MALAVTGFIATTDPSRFSGLLRSELERYMDYQMGLEKLRTLLGPDQSILSVNGPWLEFTRVPKPGRPIDEFAAHLKKTGRELVPELVEVFRDRLKSGRFYDHQERAIDQILQGKNVVLPHPTGSGKTEAFLVPILQYILGEIRDPVRHHGLGALMIFPMKALENDQRDRLKDILYGLETKLDRRIPIIGIYDGDTPSGSDFERGHDNAERRDLLFRYAERCPRCGVDNLKYNRSPGSHLLKCEPTEDPVTGVITGCGYPEDTPPGIPWIRTLREDMQNEKYPNILITNPESLDFRLLSAQDRNVLATQMPRVIVVIDEAHAYAGSSAVSLRFLLSRLEEKLQQVNGRPIQVQYILASATLDDPVGFANKLIPWAKFEEVTFTPRASPFVGNGSGNGVALPAVGALDGQRLQWLFPCFTRSPDEAWQRLQLPASEGTRMLQTLEGLQVAKVEGGRLVPGHAEVSDALHTFTMGQEEAATTRLQSFIRARLVESTQIRDLYEFAFQTPRSLEQLVTWWTTRWPKDSATPEEVVGLVAMGRRLDLWQERWHLFVRPPTGVAACNGTTIHARVVNGSEPLPPACDKCNHPILDVWTCHDCAEVYFGYSRCGTCNQLATDESQGCGHNAWTPRVIRRDQATGLPTLQALEPFSRDPEDKCPTCAGNVAPVRRRTELLIEMSVSLLAWHTDPTHRKFLLFSDGRAAAERIGRDFNTMEEVLWAERLVMDIMLHDDRHGPHDPRKMQEVIKKLLMRLRKPYDHGLNRILRRWERDILNTDLSRAAFKALSKSASGSSRLFQHGLLGYAFSDLQEKIQQLELEKVLPRVMDLVRLHTSQDRGLPTAKLFTRFASGGARFSKHLTGLAGPNNEKIKRAIKILQEAGWIRLVNVPGDAHLFVNEGNIENSDDPWDAAQDMRKLRVPETVAHCPTCDFISWYPLDICPDCDRELESWTHAELLDRNYFAGILTRQPREVVAAIHRAGLEPLERRIIEERFRSTENLIHFLCATPTLELGIDVGLLNFVLLAKVPPTKSSYIQRVGRAGRRKNEGAICVTFAYPTPVDSYYFHHPESLVAMRTGRIPVQRLAPEHLPPLLGSALLDAFTTSTPGPIRTAFEQQTRVFLDGNPPFGPEAVRQDLEKNWDSHVQPSLLRLANRAIATGDYVDQKAIERAIDQLHTIVTTPKRFLDEFLKNAGYQEQRKRLGDLHVSVSNRIADLRRKKLSNAEQDELFRLETEDDSLRKFRDRHMMSAPLLMYLHDVGSLSTIRGIGASVQSFDLERLEASIDDRVADQAIHDRFPAGLVSRQGSIYRLRNVVYDPLNQPLIRQCTTCDKWLGDAGPCPEHPADAVREDRIRQPVVAFGELTRYRSRETRGNRDLLLRGDPNFAPLGTVKLGHVEVGVGKVQPIKVAVVCRDYDVYEDGQRTRTGEIIQACQNCQSNPRPNTRCCNNPNQQPIIQGRVFQTRGARFTLNPASVTAALAALPPQITEDLDNPQRTLTQSLANAMLNVMGIRMDVEPGAFDCRLDTDTSFWIYEPTPGGNGLLGELLRSTDAVAGLLPLIRDLTRTRPGEHECHRYCDSCLIIPRYSHEELTFLSRPLVDRVTTS